MKESILRDKSKAFAIRMYKFLLEEKKEFVISKQILRCGTSIGANFAEAIYGVSEADFMNKLSIAQKEAMWQKLSFLIFQAPRRIIIIIPLRDKSQKRIYCIIAQ